MSDLGTVLGCGPETVAAGGHSANGVLSASQHLAAWLRLVQLQVNNAVERRRRTDPDDDPFRGLYVSDAHVNSMLTVDAGQGSTTEANPIVEGVISEIERDADEAERHGARLPLRRLADSFGLDTFDIHLLILAMAPDLDPRFERLYGYLNDDVAMRRASVGLALEMVGAPLWSGSARARLLPHGALAKGGLIALEEPQRPFLTRTISVDDRVTAHLLGDPSPDPRVSPLLVPLPPPILSSSVSSEALTVSRLVYLRDDPSESGRSHVAAMLEASGAPALSIDLRLAGQGDDLIDLASRADLEARLTGGVIAAGPIEVLVERGPEFVRAWADVEARCVLLGQQSWDPAWSRKVALVVASVALDSEGRRHFWKLAIGEENAEDPNLTAAVAEFRLSPAKIERAVVGANLLAALEARLPRAADLRAGARAQNSPALERLARRIEPRLGWEDLILPPEVTSQLRDIVTRVRERDRVDGMSNMARSALKGRGVTALFSGPSGTGKTISAEVVAGALGVDLYVINLATVVDKYIGETEKHLDHIFAETARINGALLFDEADALFGKRSEVRDSHDRYANLEAAHLLQQLEQFNGLAILTTNLASHLDSALLRRIHQVVVYREPDRETRARLWAHHLRLIDEYGINLDRDALSTYALTGADIFMVCTDLLCFIASHSRRHSEPGAQVEALIRRNFLKHGRLQPTDPP